MVSVVILWVYNNLMFDDNIYISYTIKREKIERWKRNNYDQDLTFEVGSVIVNGIFLLY